MIVYKTEEEIELIKNLIIEYENLFINNILDLRLFYVVRIIEKLPGFKSFIVNDETLTLDEIIQDENFEYLKTNSYRDRYLIFGNKIVFAEP